MLSRTRAVILAVLVAAASAAGVPAQTQDAVSYRLTFPERVHRLMDVEVTFTRLPAAPLELRMSRSSPGRYALHEFAKNVFGLSATDGEGRPLVVTRPDPYGWEVATHPGTEQVRYRVFGDRVDGTYLGVDSTHAHINMPAALLWARGLDARPAQVRVEPPPGSNWRVATQLLPDGRDGFSFRAPNFQYLMDSPTEVSDHRVRSFMPGGTDGPTIRIAMHHDGTDAELDAFARDVERIVGQCVGIFGEYPAFEGSAYTFIADYLPWASGDGMEHRNSTILTSPSSLRTNRINLLSTAAHEFLHAWNVERIRPRSLEPFDFERANMSGELWFAEGVTSYYEPLVLHRAGLIDVAALAAELGAAVDAVVNGPGRGIHSLVEMSRMAAFLDAASTVDRTNFDNTFISYYTWGSALGLALDLSIREQTSGRASLDDVMRLLWQKHGRPGGRAPGLVANPYAADDLRHALAAVSGDAAFAGDFFRRYIEGREMADYSRLLQLAGIALTPAAPGRAWAGRLRFETAARGGRLMNAAPFGSPAYDAGLERDDIVVTAGGRPVTTDNDWRRVIESRTPGDVVPIVFERRGTRVNAQLRLVEDPRLRAVPAESIGQTVSDEQRRFRAAWLASSD
jgi:predicted metalloprotease with PDZ domain